MSAVERSKATARSRHGFEAFSWGGAIGVLSGLIGLGGAEFRLPVLVGRFRLAALEAVIINKAISLMVVVAALVFRSSTIPLQEVVGHAHVVLTLLAGSLVGAWLAAGRAIQLSARTLSRLMLFLLTTLALAMVAEGLVGLHRIGRPLIGEGHLQTAAGVAAGCVIGAVTALLGVAGGELLIPALVLLFAVDIKVAGSLSLAVSLPTMLVGFARYRKAGAFRALARDRRLVAWMAAGSVTGAALGVLLLGVVPTKALTLLLGLVLTVSAVKVFWQAKDRTS